MTALWTRRFGIVLLLAMSPAGALASPTPLAKAVAAVEGGQYHEAFEHLAALPLPMLGPQDRQRARYLLGHVALRLKRYPEALQAFGEVLEGYPELGDYALWNIARVYLELKAERLHIEALRTLLTRFPHSRLGPQARVALARQYIGVTAEWAEGVRLLEEALAHAPREAWAAEAHLLLGQAYEGLGLRDKALQAYRTLYIRFPTSPEAERAALRIVALAQPAATVQEGLSPRERLERADQLAEAGDCERALQEARHVSPAELPADLAAWRARRLGFCAFRLRRWREAIAALEPFRARFAADERAPEALYTLGLAHQREARPSEAERLWRDLADREPPTPWNAKALVSLGLAFEARQAVERALEVYRQVVARFPEAERADELAWRLGWLRYGQRQFDAAAQEFRAVGERFPRSMFASNALYWQAKALERSGRSAQALALYEQAARQFPYTYYGMRAQEILRLRAAGHAPHATPAAADQWPTAAPQQAPAAAEPTLSAAALFHRVRIDELTALRFMEDAREEMAHVAKEVGSSLAEQMWLARLYLQVDLPPQAIRTLNAALSALAPNDRLTLPADFWTLLFPLLYWAEVQEAVRGTHLDPLLILGVIRQESAFNARAVSRSDARGLMQLLPATGRQVFQRLGMAAFHAELLFDPQLNVRLGSHYLERLAAAHRGDLVLALAAYNAGPGRVQQWLQEFSTDDVDEFIERIPFEETRSYIKNVLRNYSVYRRLYAHLALDQARR
jgi:soluble lytic murein transglycosylase